MWDGILPLPHEPCYLEFFRFSLCQSGCGGGGDDNDEDDNEDDSLKHSPAILKSMLQRKGDVLLYLPAPVSPVCTSIATVHSDPLHLLPWDMAWN